MIVYAVYYPSYYYDVDSIWSDLDDAIARAEKMGWAVQTWKLDDPDYQGQQIVSFYKFL